MNVDFWLQIGPLLVPFAALPAGILLVLYLNELRYIKKTSTAINMIAFSFAVFLVLGESMIRRNFRDAISLEVRLLFLNLMVVLVGALLWQRVYMLLKYQIGPRRRAKKVRNQIREEWNRRDANQEGEKNEQGT